MAMDADAIGVTLLKKAVNDTDQRVHQNVGRPEQNTRCSVHWNREILVYRASKVFTYNNHPTACSLALSDAKGIDEAVAHKAQWLPK